MAVLAIIPARAGSKGIPGKNFRKLPDGLSPVELAIQCARAAGCYAIVSTDAFGAHLGHGAGFEVQKRPAELCGDDVPMIAVVRHVLGLDDGASNDDDPSQPIVLLQPTQPFRQPKHIQAALDLLQSSGADSVVSVVALPASHSPELACSVTDGCLRPWPGLGDVEGYWGITTRPATRQQAAPAYRLDGTVYVFTRESIQRCGCLPCGDCRPLIIPAEESCELDTEADWADVERRWQTPTTVT